MNEKNSGTATMTEETLGENSVEVTFLPEGKVVHFEHG